jgi:Domain of unknown function (DUF4330)
MAIVDERGRLGGKVNLIDAVVAFLILVLIPVAFGAYLLFRTPEPTLTAINPATLYQGPNLRIEVQGENLRPFMRVSFNSLQANSFMINTTRGAMVDLPTLDAGVYDVVLYDHMQEVSRLPKAFTLLPLAPVPTVDIRVSGAFKGLTADRMQSVKPGDKFMNNGVLVAEVESVGAPTPGRITLRAGSSVLQLPLTGQADLPAVLRLKCFVASNSDGSLKCSVPGAVQQTDVIPGGTLSLAAPGGWVTFQIDQVMSDK